jgi:hypothetical protein
MRTLLLAVAITAALPTPAAACHRYARWAYPWPQSCSVEARHLVRYATREETPSPPPPVKPPPAPTEDELRQQAIEQLKVALIMLNAAASANVPEMSPASVPQMSR